MHRPIRKDVVDREYGIKCVGSGCVVWNPLSWLFTAKQEARYRAYWQTALDEAKEWYR